MDIEVIFAAIIIFMLIALFIGYGLLVIFFPEWVGIAGKKAKEIEAKHIEENNDGPEQINDL